MRFRQTLLLLATLAVLSTVSPARADDADDRFAVATGHYAARRWKLAVEEFQTFLDKYPKHLKADKGTFLSAEAALQSGDLERAGIGFRRYLDRCPDGKFARAALFRAGETAYMAGKAKTAKDKLLRFQAKYPDDKLNAYVLTYLGDIAMGNGDTASAEKCFRECLKRFPDGRLQDDCRFGLARALERQQKCDEAERLYRAVAGKPENLLADDAQFHLAVLLYTMEKYVESIEAYNAFEAEFAESRRRPQAILSAARLQAKLKQLSDSAALYERFVQQYPDAPQLESALYQWAWVLSDQGKQSESAELFERLRREYAEGRYGADATFRLAQRALDAKDYQRAGKLIDEVLAGRPDDRIRENAMYLRGRIAVAKEQWQQVAHAFEALLEAFPKTSNKLPAEFWIAEAAYRQEDYQQAGQRFDRLAGRVRGRPEQWLAAIPLRQAQTLSQKGDWSGAYAIASKIEAKYPNFKQLHEADYLIGRCRHARADFQGAREAFRKVICSKTGEKTEMAAMAQWMIGETFFHQKNYEAALRAYLRLEILYDYPTWQAAALLQAGKCREKLGQWNEAAKLYKRVLKVYPDTLFAEMAEKRAANNPANSLTPGAGRVRRR